LFMPPLINIWKQFQSGSIFSYSRLFWFMNALIFQISRTMKIRGFKFFYCVFQIGYFTGGHGFWYIR
jgi:hypothetical protein